jgi:hypothetical protein
MIEALQPGLPTTFLQNVIYALPSIKCQIFGDQSLETSATFNGTFQNIVGSNIEPGMITTGGFVRCTTGIAQVVAKRYKIKAT